MFHPLTVLKSIGLGAGIMYFFDPVSGNRRRALVNDQLTHACAVSNKKTEAVYRDASNRLQGAKAELRSLVEPSDQGILERVQESAIEVGRTLGMQGNSLSPTAKAALALGGVGCVAAMLKKRDLGALALGALGLTFLAKEMHALQSAEEGGQKQQSTDQNSGSSHSAKQSSKQSDNQSSQSQVSNKRADSAQSVPEEESAKN